VPKTSIDLLDEVLAVLDDLATRDDRDHLVELRARVDARRLRVLIAGEAKRGKSTLVNQLIGRDVLPTGVTPVTAVVTTVRRANADEHIEVTFLDGRVARHDVVELADFVSERGNPRNERGVRTAEVFVRSDLLDRFDVELVDTPGTGSVFEHNTTAAEEALASLDAAIFVVTADPPIAAAERDLLARMSELSVHTFVALNKADQLDEAGVREAADFTAQVVGEATAAGAELFVCSARQGRSDAGFTRLADAMDRYFAERGAADVLIALRGHAARLAKAMLDATMLTVRSLQLSASSSAERVCCSATGSTRSPRVKVMSKIVAGAPNAGCAANSTPPPRGAQPRLPMSVGVRCSRRSTAGCATWNPPKSNAKAAPSSCR